MEKATKPSYGNKAEFLANSNEPRFFSIAHTHTLTHTHKLTHTHTLAHSREFDDVHTHTHTHTHNFHTKIAKNWFFYSLNFGGFLGRIC